MDEKHEIEERLGEKIRYTEANIKYYMELFNKATEDLDVAISKNDIMNMSHISRITKERADVLYCNIRILKELYQIRGYELPIAVKEALENMKDE